jgi:uncharacterized protein YciI
MPVFAVTTARGPNWDHARGIREQPYWNEHAVFADMLVDRGVIILGGPVASDNDEDIALLAVEAPDEHAVRSIFDADPWAVHQVFRIKHVRAWAGDPVQPGPPLDRKRQRRSCGRGRMLVRYRSGCRGPAAYWSRGTGS